VNIFRYEQWQPFDSGRIQDSRWFWIPFLLFLATYVLSDELSALYWFLILLVIAILVVLTYKVLARWGNVTSKFYKVTPELAEEVIRTILQNEAIGFLEVEGGFEAGEDDLFIGVRKMSIGRHFITRGTLIKLEPITPENEFLIYRLQHYLDEAFLQHDLA
jgi:hypothetical protein